MIRWLCAWACAVCVLCVSAGSAAASGYGGFVTLPGMGLVDFSHATSTTIPLRVSGDVVVAFHADSATGCSQMAGCGYHGTQILKPSSADVSIERYTTHGRRHRFAALTFDATSQSSAPEEFARVIRDGGGVCADASAADFGFTAGRWRHARLVIPLFTDTSPLRCAGPAPWDLASASPALTLPQTPHRGQRIDARSVRSFASHGFAGTVTSSLVFTVGHVSTQRATNSPPGIHYQRMRNVDETLRVIGARGAFTADVRGTTMGGVCVLLDSCGLRGTLTFAPKPVGGEGFLEASGPVSLPYRDFLVALGLRPGRPRPALNPSGATSWARGGNLRADLVQGARCTDTVGLGSASVYMTVSGATLRARLMAGAFLLTGTNVALGRTRCPGPELPVFQTLAAGQAPRGVLGHRTFTVSLRAGGTFADDGYTVALHGQLSLTFKRGRPTSHVIREPAP